MRLNNFKSDRVQAKSEVAHKGYADKEARREYLKEWKKEHRRKYMNSYNRANPEKRREYQRKTDLRRSYGVTVEWYEATLQAQAGVCAICRRPPGKHRLAVDHNHVTGKVRGLLCDRCNPLLERVETTPDWMDSALAYLTKYEIGEREKELAGGQQWQDQK